MESDGVHFEISIKNDVPEVEAMIRKIVADFLRERADEGPVSPEELREIAAMLEAGQL